MINQLPTELSHQIPPNKQLPVVPVEATAVRAALEKGSLTLGKGQTVAVAVERFAGEDKKRRNFDSGIKQTVSLPEDVLTIPNGRTTNVGVDKSFPGSATLEVIPTTEYGVGIKNQLDKVRAQSKQIEQTAINKAAEARGLTPAAFSNDLEEMNDLRMRLANDASNKALVEQISRFENSLIQANQTASVALGEKLGLFDKAGATNGIKSNTVASLPITVPTTTVV